MRCRSYQKSARRVLAPGSAHHESEPTFRRIARKRPRSDWRWQSFVSQVRAKVPHPLHQSRRRSRYGRILSSGGRFYRPSNLMQTPQTKIHISIRDQRLTLKRGDTPIRSYPVSTSQFGIGTEEGSMKTPTGRFRVAEKIGAELPLDTVFQSSIPLQPGDPLPPTEDWVMSRILWLDGVEEHNANTRERFIYIHGTKHENKIGSPASHGCIRMRNADVIDLFDLVDEDTPVVIRE